MNHNYLPGNITYIVFITLYCKLSSCIYKLNITKRNFKSNFNNVSCEMCNLYEYFKIQTVSVYIFKFYNYKHMLYGELITCYGIKYEI